MKLGDGLCRWRSGCAISMKSLPRQTRSSQTFGGCQVPCSIKARIEEQQPRRRGDGDGHAMMKFVQQAVE